LKRDILPRQFLMKKPPERADQTTSLPRRRRGRIARNLVLIVGCVLIVDALVGDRGLLAMLKARDEYRALDQALGHLRTENAHRRETARRLREDPDAIEALARREHGLIRPGEKLFIVKDIEPKIDTSK
jgi:cell division protein FtsB